MTRDADGTEVERTVRALLDAMRSAHLQMVLGDPVRAEEYVSEAAAAHRSLAELFVGHQDNEALAGRVMYEVLGQRCASLRGLIKESSAAPKTSKEVVDFVAEPLPPTRIRAPKPD